MIYNVAAGLTIVGLVYSVILIIIFYSKKNNNSIESNLFRFIMWTTFVSCFIEFYIQNFMVSVGLSEVTNDIINKLAFGFNEFYCLLLLLYAVLKCNCAKMTRREKIRVLNINVVVFGFIWIVSFFPLGLLPLEYTYNRTGEVVLFVTGSSVNIAFAICGIYLVGALVTMIYALIRKQFKANGKTVFWTVFVLAMCLGALGYQIASPTFTVCQFVQMLLLVYIYFNIENPDKRLVEEVKKAKEAADELNDNKSNFLSNMSHEIRTPLNAIIGLSKHILEKDNIPSGMRDDINDIVLASNNLLEIVANIIDINKIESELTQVKEAEYNFKGELQSLVKVVGSKIENKPIVLGIMIDPNIPDVLIGDMYCAKTILNNLLDNAIKYTDKGQITVSMKMLSIDSEKCEIELVVSDTGVGIKSDKLTNLFNKFESVDFTSEGNDLSKGVGLPIVYKLVNLMNGKINVQSQVGTGSTFTVVFPQKVVKPKQVSVVTLANPEVPKEEPKVETPANSTITVEKDEVKKVAPEMDMFAGKRALIVDDNKINLKVAKKNIDGLGFIIDECESGQKCLDNVKGGIHYDVILMDIMMPGMDGVETLKALKQIGGFNTPVIAVTADAIAGAKEKYLGEGFNDYVSKPFTKEQIIKSIEQVFKSV